MSSGNLLWPDVVAMLPTGDGKSMIFYLLPALLHYKMRGQSLSSSQVHPVVIIVSPLNALTKDQIQRTSQGTLKRHSAYLELDVGKAKFHAFERR